MKKYTFGAVDIGSNAIRLNISEMRLNSDNSYSLLKLNLTRLPIRLGADSFGDEKLISKKNEDRIIQAIESFKIITNIYGTINFKITATSAMREANNGKEVIRKIHDKTGVKIDLLSGNIEAKMIYKIIDHKYIKLNGKFLFIDVGGGSTEITIFDNNKIVKSHSFELGTVRLLNKKDNQLEWKKLDDFLSDISLQDYVAIGTGGNIYKYHDISGNKELKPLSIKKLESIYKKLNKLNFEKRMEKFNLKEDRADVIIPAGEIFLYILKKSEIKEIICPKIGLSDGIIINMFEEYIKNN